MDTLADALIAGNGSFFLRMDLFVTLDTERYQIVSGIVSELTSGSYMVDLELSETATLLAAPPVPC